jgi:hypothetical protein
LSTYSIKCFFVAVLLERKEAGAQTPLNLHPPPPPPASSSNVYRTQHHHHLILKNLRIPDLYTFGRIIREGRKQRLTNCYNHPIFSTFIHIYIYIIK